MKQRSIAWSLLFAVLLTAISAVFSVTAETEDMLTNVALGAKYESSAPYVLDADKHTNNYRNKDYDELTDGEKGSDPVGDEWYAFIGGQEYYITIDLGKTYDDLARIAVECCNKEDWGIVLPASIKASGSVDGKEYTDLGTFTDLNEGDTGAYHSYVLDISGEYRYIRIDLKKAGFFTFVSEVEVYAPVSDEEPITAEYCLPVDGEIIRAYSDTALVYFPSMKDYRVHLGVDIAVPLGTEVLCYTGGVVIAVYQDTMMGTTVEVSHQDGLVSYYKNLDVTLADGIEAGQSVSAGQVIGTVGNTAVLEKVEEPHLHFELYQNDKSIDPEPYLLAMKENGGTNIPACLYGDVNDDGVVNGNDVTRLLRHLASYDAEMDSSTVEVFDGADCNGDGMIDGRDAVRLIRYLAYLDPATGESSVVLGPETQEPETPAPEVFVPELGDGTEETPYLVIPNTKTLSMTTVAIDAGQSVVYGIQRIGGKSVTINDPDAYIVYEGVRYEAVDGVLSVQLEPVLASEDILLEIGNDGAAEQSFVLQFSDPVGSYENPTTVDLSEKSYNISLAADDSDGFYYRYTATNNGTIRFLMTASTNGLLSVTNNSDFVQRTSDFDGQTDENGWTYIEIDVQTGEELLIVVGALPNRRGKYPAIDIVWMAQYID